MTTLLWQKHKDIHNPLRKTSNLLFHAEEMTDSLWCVTWCAGQRFKSKGNLSNSGIPNTNHAVWVASWRQRNFLPSQKQTLLVYQLGWAAIRILLAIPQYTGGQEGDTEQVRTSAPVTLLEFVS